VLIVALFFKAPNQFLQKKEAAANQFLQKKNSKSASI